MAKGKDNGLFAGKSFALSGGDATASYKGALGKAIRHIIFINPDMFIIIDDLRDRATIKLPSSFGLTLKGY